MKASKLLVSTAATAAVVSAIGFTYAQTGYNKDDTAAALTAAETSSSNTNLAANSTITPKSDDATPAPGGNMSSGPNTSADNTAEKSESGSTSTTGTASNDSSNTANERLARVDRN